jgi:GNAT superfamily N-acetyltransferase
VHTSHVNDAEMLQVKAMWRDLTTAGQGFFDLDLVYKSTDSHRAAPEGWVAIVRLGRQVVVAGPNDQLDRIDSNTRQSWPTQLVQAEHLDEFVCPRHTLGPARLYYGASSGTSPSAATAGPLAVDDARVAAVLADATDDERGESAIEDTTSGVFVALTADGAPGAVAAWRVWPHEVAHISVLCARSHRRTGVGFAAAHRAIAAAADAGLLPQWRVREDNVPSIALAERLGLRHIGDQYSIRLD